MPGLRPPPNGDAYLTELVSILNAELFRKEPTVVGVVYDAFDDTDDLDVNILTATSIRVGATQVVGAQGAAVADAENGAVVDAEARAALNALLARVRAHGLIASE